MIGQIETGLFFILLAVWLAQELTPRMYEITYRREDGRIVTEWCFQKQADFLLKDLGNEKHFKDEEIPAALLIHYEVVTGWHNWKRCMVWQEVHWEVLGDCSCSIVYNHPRHFIQGD